MIRELLGSQPTPRVLELGIGVGVFAEQIFSQTSSFHGVDICLEHLHQTKKRFKEIRFVQANVEELPYLDSSFDFIFGISVMHHLDAAAALREAHRVLRKGGKLLLTEPNILNPQVFVMKKVGFLKPYFGEVSHETAFFKLSLRRLLNDCGFRDIRVENFDFLHPSIPRSLLDMLEPICILLERIPLVKEISGSLIISGEK